MPVLSGELRGKLERAVQFARDAGEVGARKALEALAVHHHEPHGSMTPEQKALRNRLRAHGRQLGDVRDARRGTQEIERLTHECAYEHWHRMLFARFLAENYLLIEPTSGVAISMVECEEIARESGEDPWALASRFAQRMLPQIFRADDPALQVGLPPESRQALERLLADLPAAVFTAEDSLGWTYQFWQSAEKDRVNASGEKITGKLLPAVTQLFTEHYMVLFLLHNTIGAWHAGKALAGRPELAAAASEQELRDAAALDGYSFDYLRFVRSPGEENAEGPWRPAAGVFDGWPRRAAELRVLDPCCGSGHFLVAAFELLVRLRMAEEGLALEDAIRAVLSENLFGLELDPRCTQIAAFYLALAAWRMLGTPIGLPVLNIACCGLGPNTSEEDWLSLADQSQVVMSALSRAPIRNGLLNMHALFARAPELGSLIDPTALSADLIAADWDTLQPYLSAILKIEAADEDVHEHAVAAAGMAKAASILVGTYALVITNVPYLGLRKMDPRLKTFCERQYLDARHDFANVMLDRSIRLVSDGGTVAVVTPQAWFFAGSFASFRNRWLTAYAWNVLARLGPSAFETISGEVVNVGLLVVTNTEPVEDGTFVGIDCEGRKSADQKSRGLVVDAIGVVSQHEQLSHPDQRILLTQHAPHPLLNEIAVSLAGIQNGDSPVYQRAVWEVPLPSSRWVLQQTVAERTSHFSGFDTVLDFDIREGHLRAPASWRREALHDSDQRGKPVWGRQGVLVSRMSNLPCTLYLGDPFDQASAVIVPHDPAHVLPVWAYCSSAEFREAVRRIDKKLNVTSATLAKVPFEVERWRQVAETNYPNGLPDPSSDDPTQWLFHGRPEASTAPLQVAVARLLGYRWPAELDEQMRLSTRARDLVQRCAELAQFSDADGIVCIPSVRGERPAADRLAALLTACGLRPDRDLDAWLREEFFAEHCDLFHHRPFIWHIWDGRKDGFHALVNYHKLAAPDGGGRRLLESIAYSYLGAWIDRQKAEQREGKDGADARLAAALDLQDQLKKILEGEPPFDVFARWKPLHEQPIGWEPDINDGVRVNMRPFLSASLRKGGKAGAGILRAKPNINWKKDRGQEPESLRPKASFPWFWSCDPEKKPEHRQEFMGGATFDGNRWNDLHYSNDTKREARERRTREQTP